MAGGAGGRPRKPAKLKLLEGNPGHRPIGEEPEPELVDDLDPPDWLDELAGNVWRELAPELRRLELLTVLDRPLLAAACEQYALYRRATRAVNRSLTMRTKANGLTAKPQIGIARQALALARQLFGELGVTATARARLGVVDAAKPEDEDEDFLNSRPEADEG